jgi:hypothetical protein
MTSVLQTYSLKFTKQDLTCVLPIPICLINLILDYLQESVTFSTLLKKDGGYHLCVKFTTSSLNGIVCFYSPRSSTRWKFHTLALPRAQNQALFTFHPTWTKDQSFKTSSPTLFFIVKRETLKYMNTGTNLAESEYLLLEDYMNETKCFLNLPKCKTKADHKRLKGSFLVENSTCKPKVFEFHVTPTEMADQFGEIDKFVDYFESLLIDSHAFKVNHCKCDFLSAHQVCLCGSLGSEHANCIFVDP